ncbi:TATA box-binding protein-associated factor RNA polymerase I subunit B [Schistocerca americana]|uniref:TATA box-binding protein-associated factor RNA polymerase I subunit B n=1 Tax=Schistocerca americana TaxID=7009 RepID=UPI001F4F9C2C|nr:TATA box-binding protein-associated factor RNA polymerase I subunit B [Schistocerca americana]
MTDNRPACAVCGGTDYCVEAGFYYCSECHTQSQDIREEVFETWNDENNEISQDSSSKRKKRKLEPDPDREWTTWEAYNWILKGLVDEVIELGAKPSLKELVLQLWASYLRKMGVAFTSKKNQAMPKLGVDFDIQDASLICGIKMKSETSSRKSSSCKSVKSASSMSQSTVSSSYTSSRYLQRKKFQSKRRKLMVEEAKRVQQDVEASLDFSSQLEQSLRERESSVETISIVSCSSRSRGCGSEVLLKERKRLLRKICGARGMYKGHKRVGNSDLRSSADPNFLGRTRLLNLIHLGLLVDCSEQQLSDLLRWIREGHLSYQHVTHFFPQGVCIKKSDRTQFGASVQSANYSTILKGTGLLIKWLGVKYVPVPDVHKLVERQVHELGLPDMMITLVERLAEFIPILPYFEENKYFYSFEVQTMAMIIFVLKLLLGLDDRTEHSVSETAERLNELYVGDDLRLFSWDRWVCWFERRKQLLVRHHIPTRDLIDPREEGNTQQLIEHWKRAVKDERLCEKVKTMDHLFKGLKPQTVEILKRPLLLLAERHEKSYNLYFPATLRPLSTYSTIIITHKCPKQQNSLRKNFNTSDMNFMLDPSEVLNLAEEKNIKLKILMKSAHSSFKRLLSVCRRCKYDNVYAKISVVSDERSEMCSGRRRKRTEVIPLHSLSSKEKKRFCQKKVKNNRELRMTNNIKDKHSLMEQNDHSFSREHNKCNTCKHQQKSEKKKKGDCLIRNSSTISNSFYLQSEEFLNFHIKTVSQSSGVIRQPTILEKGIVGLATTAQRKSIKRLKKKLLNGITRSGRECLKLYLPYRHYWICSGSYEKGEISDEQFESIIRKLPTSFSWLLQECARILEVEKRYLYCELLRVEGAALCVHS